MAVIGFVVLLTAPVMSLARRGFLLIGLDAANLVPVLFRKARSQTVMPPALASGAISKAAYVGILTGSAAIGFISKAVGLHNAFWMLALLLCFTPCLLDISLRARAELVMAAAAKPTVSSMMPRGHREELPLLPCAPVSKRGHAPEAPVRGQRPSAIAPAKTVRIACTQS